MRGKADSGTEPLREHEGRNPARRDSGEAGAEQAPECRRGVRERRRRCEPVCLADRHRLQRLRHGGRRTQAPDAAIAPIVAPIRDRDPWAVFAAANGRALKRRVKLCGCAASNAWIEEGLAPAGLVIAYPSDSGQT